MMEERISTIQELLQLGSQYGPRPDNQLDTSSGSAPAKLDLARELYDRVPEQLGPYRDELDMRVWVKEAVDLLDALRGKFAWSQLEDRQRDFAKLELLPFLHELLSTPPESPDW